MRSGGHGVALCGMSVLLWGCVGAVRETSRSEVSEVDSSAIRGRVPPELVFSPRHWINGVRGMTLEDLRGKVVWLQFNF